MSKQEEIREGLTLLISECYSKDGSACKSHPVFQPQVFLNKLFPYLDSQGVVLKIEGELPSSSVGRVPTNEYEEGYNHAYKDIVKRAAYVKVESLLQCPPEKSL